jgi:hypothetical protein
LLITQTLPIQAQPEGEGKQISPKGDFNPNQVAITASWFQPVVEAGRRSNPRSIGAQD